MSTRKPEDFRNEIASHIEQEALRRMERGVPQAEAWAEARRTFGNVTAAQERFYESGRWMWFDTLARDFRHAVRALSHSRAFTCVAITSLALGIGANTAAFSLVDAVLLKMLPVRNPEELRIVNFVKADDLPFNSYSGFNDRDAAGREVGGSYSYPAFVALQSDVQQIDSLVGFAGDRVAVTVDGSTDTANGQMVSGNYFSGLGVQAFRGRVLQPSDDQPGSPLTVTITYGFWERRLGRDPNVIGRSIFVNRIPATIVGVLPRSFQGLAIGAAQDVFLPLTSVAQLKVRWASLTANNVWWVQIFGRVRPGISDASAAASLHSVLAAQIESYAPGRHTPEMVLNPGGYGISGFFRAFNLPSIWVLVAVAALILLICCVNLANLLLGRGASRGREISVRLSLGATRWNVVRHLFTESMLVSLAGGLLGAMIAHPLLTILLRYLAGQSTLNLNASVDARALLFTFAASMLTAILFGALPALRATKIDLMPTLKDGGSGGGLTARAPISHVLVVAQVALSTLLLIGASLLTRTFLQLANADLGFTASHLLTFRAVPGQSGYAGQRLDQVYAEIRRKIEAIPGVASVALSDVGLLQGSSSNGGIFIPGMTAKPASWPQTWYLLCSDSFLPTMDIALLAGRGLQASDTRNSEKVAVVNETFVRRYLAGINPLGQVFHDMDSPKPKPETPAIRIVGVVSDARYSGIRDGVPPTAYMPFSQSRELSGMTFAIRTPLDPAGLANSVRAAIAGINRDIPVVEMRTQEEQVSRVLGREQLLAALSSGFGLLAAVLAAIGLYGLMAYTVARRTPEFGIRMALGATRFNVQWLTLRGSLWMVGVGLILGIGAGLALMKFLQSFLYQVEPTDAVSFVAAAVLMVIAGALAAWLPARRASNVDPLTALRHE